MAIPEPLLEVPLHAVNHTVSHWLPRDGREDFLDLDAPYQRGPVWDDDRRASLIRSLLMGLPIGSVITARLGYNQAVHIRVVDGKQRIQAIRMFFDNRVPVPGWWFRPTNLADPEARTRQVTAVDLSDRGRRRLENISFPAIEFDSMTYHYQDGSGKWHQHKRPAQETLRIEAELYLLVNFGGVPQEVDDHRQAIGVMDATREINLLRRGLSQIVVEDYPSEACDAGTWAAELLANPEAALWTTP